MTASYRNMAVAGVVAIYLTLIAILATAVWDDHKPVRSAPLVHHVG